MKKLSTVLLVIFVIAICWSVLKPKKDAKHVNELRFRVTAEPPSMDWTLANDHVSKDFMNNLMEGLIQTDKHLNTQPALASKWSISNDGLRYTFHLRKDVKWTDGKPLTAHDFVFSWKRLLTPATASEYAYFLFDIKNAAAFNGGKVTDFDQVGVHAKDNHTLVVDLWHPAAYFPSLHSFWVTFPQREDIVKKHGNRWTDPKNIVTLGPFKLKSWAHDYRVILEANPTYYGAKPKIEQITAYIVNEDSTALSLYETGKIDILRKIPPVAVPKYIGRADHRTHPFLRGYYYGFNTAKEPFDDVRVRKAIAHAIDRTHFPTILQGNQIPATSWVPKGMFGYEPDVGLGFDLEKAQRLLSEAGYPNGKGFPKMELVFDTRDDNKIVAENLQAQLKKNLNIEVEIINQEWKIHLKKVVTDAPHFWRLGWGADFPDPDNFLNLFTSYSGNNHTRWKSKEYDDLIVAGAKESDATKRKAIYRRAQQILTEEDVPMIPLFIESLNFLVKPHVKDYHIDAMNMHRLKNVRIANND